jgi:hypothetical protein
MSVDSTILDACVSFLDYHFALDPERSCSGLEKNPVNFFKTKIFRDANGGGRWQSKDMR